MRAAWLETPGSLAAWRQTMRSTLVSSFDEQFVRHPARVLRALLGSGCRLRLLMVSDECVYLALLESDICSRWQHNNTKSLKIYRLLVFTRGCAGLFSTRSLCAS